MGNKPTRRIRYKEGQWFAVPLTTSGYAIGILVRGSSQTQGGLGYFFGPKFETVPTESDVERLYSEDAILIRWFSDLGITRGEWPLIQTERMFQRSEWPVPQFGSIDLIDETQGWLVTYSQDDSGEKDDISRIHCDVSRVIGLSPNVTSGHEAIRIVMTAILEDNRADLAYVGGKKRPAENEGE
jgi:hypothetical protein